MMRMVLFRGDSLRMRGQGEHKSMPTLKLHYEGWIALPASLRTSLALRSGDRLEADLVDGAIVLRLLARTRPSGQAASPAASAELSGPSMPVENAAPTKPGPGRPRKRALSGDAAAPVGPKRGPGRPRKVPLPEPAFSANPLAALGPAKLLKKAELAVKPPPENALASPPLPARRIRPDSSVQPVERRPFRNVEVRPLGPGRGHNRQRRFHTRDG
jgi:bifunctional DNA-binding transcriptional regulator/antitoxin component of YhaV-PrlF toxin-antitoxin module